MNPALLIIDVQKGIDDTTHWGGNRNNPEAEGNIKSLLAAWRKNRYPVFIIQHCSLSLTSPFYPGKPGNELKDFIFVVDNEHLVQKNRANAFLDTSLREDLLLENVSHVVITGFVTNNSVESTARMSRELGFATVVVSDATACFNKKAMDGTIYPSETIHQISLCNLQGEYAAIRTTQGVLSDLNNSSF
jgi:nicotinamidase-related amidase